MNSPSKMHYSFGKESRFKVKPQYIIYLSDNLKFYPRINDKMYDVKE